jgi:hypothetical protein
MIRRTTWILLGLFVVLVAFAFWYQKGEPGRQAQSVTPTTPTVYVFPTDEANIAGLAVAKAGGPVVSLGRDSAGQWALLQPQSSGVDAGAVEAYMSELTTMRVETTLETPPPLEAVGLVTPTYTITVTQNSAAPVIAQVGRATPTGSGYYLQVKGQPNLVIVNKTGMDALLAIVDKPPLPPTPTPAVTDTAEPQPTGASPTGTTAP